MLWNSFFAACPDPARSIDCTLKLFRLRMEQEAYRHVPYDVEVEQALLGAILVDNQALERVQALIRPEHFYDPLHARIFETMSQAMERGSFALTPLTLHAAMKADPGLMEVGGTAYLAGLAQAAPTGASVDFDKLSVTMDGPPDSSNLPRLANTIVNSLLRQIG